MGESEWAKISAGVRQRSLLGLLLFLIFTNDIFLFLQKRDLENFADDYITDNRISTIIGSLWHKFFILSEQFYINFMVLNPDKCSFTL